MASKWKAMETAPKTGAEFLAYSATKNEMFVVYWGKERWLLITLSSGKSISVADLTHWRWTPKPPA